jgi:hypothetical protein
MPTTLFQTGDAVRGAKVLIRARRLSPVRVVMGSHRHQTQEITAYDNARCTIEQPLVVRPKAYVQRKK